MPCFLKKIRWPSAPDGACPPPAPNTCLLQSSQHEPALPPRAGASTPSADGPKNNTGRPANVTVGVPVEIPQGEEPASGIAGLRWALTSVLAPRISYPAHVIEHNINMRRGTENTFSEDCNRGGAFHLCLPVPFASAGMPGRPVNKDKALLTMSTEITKQYCQRDRLRLGFCSAMSDRQILNARQSAEIPRIGCNCIDVHKQSCKVCFLARVPAGTRENVV